VDPKEYGEKFSTTVMNSYVALEIAIGYTLGLLSAPKKCNSPVTSQELAEQQVKYLLIAS
jgi:hypothetical protein